MLVLWLALKTRLNMLVKYNCDYDRKTYGIHNLKDALKALASSPKIKCILYGFSCAFLKGTRFSCCEMLGACLADIEAN